MNRDELLTKLAMELGEWPKHVRPAPADAARHSVDGWHWCDLVAKQPVMRKPGLEPAIYLHDWLAERERLINKPSWADAPEWAEWLVQGPKTGDWVWVFGEKPVIKDDEHGIGWVAEPCSFGVAVESGVQPAGHDWRNTLEKRPTEKSPGSRLNDDMLARDAGMKLDTTKPRLDLLFSDMPLALEAIGRVLTSGAEKYAPGNWMNVEDAQRRYQAAALRHDLAVSRGEEFDPETDEHHLAHAACCALFRLELALREGEE